MNTELRVRNIQVIAARIRTMKPAQQSLFRRLIAGLVTAAGVPRYSREQSAIIIARSFEIASQARTPAQIAEAEAWYLQDHRLRYRQSYGVPITFDVED